MTSDQPSSLLQLDLGSSLVNLLLISGAVTLLFALCGAAFFAGYALSKLLRPGI